MHTCLQQTCTLLFHFYNDLRNYAAQIWQLYYIPGLQQLSKAPTVRRCWKKLMLTTLFLFTITNDKVEHPSHPCQEKDQWLLLLARLLQIFPSWFMFSQTSLDLLAPIRGPRASVADSRWTRKARPLLPTRRHTCLSPSPTHGRWRATAWQRLIISCLCLVRSSQNRIKKRNLPLPTPRRRAHYSLSFLPVYEMAP